MADEKVTFDRSGAVGVATLNHGKANAISMDVIDALNGCLDEVAKSDDLSALVITGRPGMLSGGFDLAVMGQGGKATFELVTAGGDLARRIYANPFPVVVAAGGHAVAMGALLLLSGHYRLAADGAFKIGLIETAIGMVLPDWSLALAEERLSKRHWQQATVEARVYTPGEAVDAGYVDRVAAPDVLIEAAVEEANRLAGLNQAAYAGITSKVRGPGAERIAALLDVDRKMIAGMA
ncbi:MAG: crotonase/enoyl-CoA hydratase family protein [Acidimicrobiales bacterium]